MNHIFGHKFSSTYGETAVKSSAFSDRMELTDTAETWAVALAGFTGEQITVGLRHCLTWKGEWCPDLRDFVKMCKMKPPPKIYRAGIESDELVERRKEQYEAGIADIKKILKDGWIGK